ncbi:MAG: sodium ion-translocating decarboxylase subunit beta, partial [Alphaproteobacteria bacterium]
VLYHMGIENGLFPLLIFMGVGAMIDFGPMLANPKSALLGGAAQFAIFGTFLGAIVLGSYVPFFDVTIKQAASIAIIGGADGPTSIFLSSRLAPELLGAIAVAAYSYMALVPVIQPPVMRALTTKKERLIRMKQLRVVSKREKILFPIVTVILTGLFIPMALPLVGMLMFGNLLKESGVTDRLADTAANSLVNIVTLVLGLSVGSKMSAELFLNTATLVVLMLGVIAFAIGTGSGVLMAKLLNLFSENKINPLIGSAGVSAIPMAARVSHKLGLEEDADNHLLMHAMGANVAGSLGSAIAAGILLALCS